MIWGFLYAVLGMVCAWAAIKGFTTADSQAFTSSKIHCQASIQVYLVCHQGVHGYATIRVTYRVFLWRGLG